MKPKHISILLLILFIGMLFIGLLVPIKLLIIIACILLTGACCLFAWDRVITRKKIKTLLAAEEQQVIVEKAVSQEYLYHFDEDISGTGNMMEFTIKDLFWIRFKSKSKNHLYMCEVRDIFDSSYFHEDTIIIKVDISQMIVNGKCIKTERREDQQNQIHFESNFPQGTWPEQYQGKTFRVRVFEKKLPREKKAE